jgi:hypothetical protein
VGVVLGSAENTNAMFSIARSKTLRSLAWSVDQSNDVEYIEAWKYSQVYYQLFQ